MLHEISHRQATTQNLLPYCQSLFLTQEGSVVMQGVPLVNGAVDVPAFDEEALIKALRVDQADESTFPEFLDASWRAGVVCYDVHLEVRTVAYHGCNRGIHRSLPSSYHRLDVNGVPGSRDPTLTKP